MHRETSQACSQKSTPFCLPIKEGIYNSAMPVMSLNGYQPGVTEKKKIIMARERGMNEMSLRGGSLDVSLPQRTLSISPTLCQAG